MTQSIVISKKVETAVQPKPTKKELIEAMAQIQFKKLTEEKEKEEARRIEYRKAFDASLLEYAKTRIQSATWTVRRYFGSIVMIDSSIALRDLPPSLEKRRNEIEKWTLLPNPNLKDIRREIAARLNNLTPTDDRVKTLVETPEVVAGLKKGLKQLGF